MSKRDYYEVLGVARGRRPSRRSRAPTASSRMQHHPDRNPGDKAAEEKFKEAAEAYAVLADARQARGLRPLRPCRRQSGRRSRGLRSEHLRRLRRHLRRPRRHLRVRRQDGSSRGPRPRRRPALRPRDHVRGSGQGHRDLAEDSARGNLRDVPRLGRGGGLRPGDLSAVPRARARCAISRASSPWRGPAVSAAAPGASSPSRVRPAAATAASRRSVSSRSRFPRASPPASACVSPAKASTAPQGGPPGDLYIIVHVAEHPLFRREDDDLHCEIAVGLHHAGARRHREGADARRRGVAVDSGRHAERRDASACAARACPTSRAAGAAISTSR